MCGPQLAGTLNVPLGRGPFPAVVWVHGAGESARLPYDGAPLVQALVDSGIAVLSYDKRGVGESVGECCPGDYGQFNLLAADVDGAVAALRSRPEIDPSRIGLLGASQAGWVYRWRRFAPTGVWPSLPWWTRPQSPPERKTSTVKGAVSRDHF